MMTFYGNFPCKKGNILMDTHCRQRLRPWLESRIDSGQIPGLRWLNREKQIFRVPWKHGGKHDWNEQDSLIFKEWAVHTGRYREGVDTADWPTWKTRFRCALNKLPDIKEEKDLSCLDGPEPYRAYKFIPKHVLSALKMEKTHPTLIKKESQSHLPYEINGMDQQSGILSIINGTDGLSSLPSDLGEMNIDLLEREDTCMDNDVSNSSVSFQQHNGMHYQAEMVYPVKQEPMQTSDSTVTFKHPAPVNPRLNINPQKNENQMDIKLHFRQQTLMQFNTSNGRGCRLYYGGEVHEIGCPSFQRGIYGPEDVDNVAFPDVSYIENDSQKQLTEHLLKALERGVVLECERGNIYATRKCKCVVFVSSLSQPPEPYKLQRDVRTPIFNFDDYFQPLMYRYINGSGVKPSVEVLLGFGQNWKSCVNPQTNLLISATVYSSLAKHMLSIVTCSTPTSPSLEISKSDDYDKFIDNLRQLSNRPVQQYNTSIMQMTCNN